MRVLTYLCLTTTWFLAGANSILGQVVGRAVSDQHDVLVSFDQLDADYDISGDMFGVRSRDFPDPPDCFECPGLPFTMLDQTFDLFDPRPTDRFGIVRSEDFAPFFGVVDTVNDIGDDWNSAVWTFDITGASSFRISADMAAMGDFEAGNIKAPSQDAFVFDYSMNGGPYEIFFESSVDTQISQDYAMELPHPDNPIITLDDPLFMNGVMLNNVFQTISAEVSGSGSQLEIRFRAITDGGEEAFAFRNLIVESTGPVGGIEGPGDYNNNGQVEQGDLDLVLLHWGRSDVPVEWINDFPVGNIDQAELDSVLLNWGITVGPSGATAVPEPSSLAIAMLVLATLILTARRG